ncbi:hypothetical protein SASPL_150653 [Salvia splendens]|uniref:VDE lipocalin domain-containing protein n=1 Tax=Salvia splendens TaxID=180675 RepID=A0A8X8W786_SALSN|nr:hypothetical protein SASPL_150653 [Salvia splendens]
MAFSLYSGVLSNGESKLLHDKSMLASCKRYGCSRANLNGNLIVRVGSGKWSLRYLKLLKPHQFRGGLGSRQSPLETGKTPSSRGGIGLVIAEVKKKLRLLSEVARLEFWKKRSYVEGAAVVVALALMMSPSAEAVDALKTCTCLLKECRIELAKCIANPSCAANVACLNTCNNRPDETECQIKCGDLFANSVVDEFNDCAVSRKKCVPRKSDLGEFPAPDPALLVQNFNMSDFNGKWFISSVQNFVQDPIYPGILYNHDNEYLHYQDDWYILSAQVENQPDDYIFVYYRGRNDAWDGYGGAVIYTRSAVLPESIVPRLETAAKSVGRDLRQFIKTDNTCGPEPPLVERLERTVEEGEGIIVREVEEIEQEVEQEVERAKETETTLFQRLAEGFKELIKDRDYFLEELNKEEMDLLNDLKMEATEVEKLFGGALPLRKLR